MPGERVTFESITQVYREEKSKKGLVALPKDFYQNMRTYISELQKRCDEEDAQASHSPKSIILHDELKKALKKRDEIWKIRMRKLVTFASSKLMGASIDKKPMTGEELRIFEEIMGILKGGTDEVFGLIEEREEEGTTAESVEREDKVETATEQDIESESELERTTPKVSAVQPEKDVVEEKQVAVKVDVKESGERKISRGWFADGRGKDKDKTHDTKEKEMKKPIERARSEELAVQILEDLPPLAGKNVNYLLKKDDVVTLPKEIASVLCKKNKARRIEFSI
jgi:DNA replication initiation complex subunit (GINS family)